MIGVMTIDLFSDQFHSLKDKRQLISSVKERLRNKFNIAVAETAWPDVWQRAQLSIVSISNSKKILGNLFRQIEEFIVAHYGIQITGIQIQYI
jgi:uncharacterized protein